MGYFPFELECIVKYVDVNPLYVYADIDVFHLRSKSTGWLIVLVFIRADSLVDI